MTPLLKKITLLALACMLATASNTAQSNPSTKSFAANFCNVGVAVGLINGLVQIPAICSNPRMPLMQQINKSAAATLASMVGSGILGAGIGIVFDMASSTEQIKKKLMLQTKRGAIVGSILGLIPAFINNGSLSDSIKTIAAAAACGAASFIISDTVNDVLK